MMREASNAVRSVQGQKENNGHEPRAVEDGVGRAVERHCCNGCLKELVGKIERTATRAVSGHLG